LHIDVFTSTDKFVAHRDEDCSASESNPRVSQSEPGLTIEIKFSNFDAMLGIGRQRPKLAHRAHTEDLEETGL
jgi:hypothetical protein